MTERARRMLLSWSPRAEPLAPAAVAAAGNVACNLARRLLARDDVALHRLSAAARTDTNTNTIIIVLGAADELPWVDGVEYLGRDPDAPMLLLPCALAPSLSPALLERAVFEHMLGSKRTRAASGASEARASGSGPRGPSVIGLAPPFALLPSPPRCVSAGAAAPIARAVLSSLLDPRSTISDP